jgi:predicted permease
MTDMRSVATASEEIVVVFLLAFGMKSIGLFNQDHAQKLLDVVINFLVPLSLVKNLPTVQLNLTWLVLPIGAVVFALLTLPVYRLIFLRAFPTLPRSDRGQLLLCCTGQAVTLVGYPVVAGFYGNSAMALCACWDLCGFCISYVATFVVAALYAPAGDDAGQSRATDVHQAGEPGAVQSCTSTKVINNNRGDDLSSNNSRGDDLPVCARRRSVTSPASRTSCLTSMKRASLAPRQRFRR